MTSSDAFPAICAIKVMTTPNVRIILCFETLQFLALDGHRHTKHNPYYKGFNCPEPNCDVVSASRAALSSHILTHTALRPFKCKLCDKAYKQKNTLADHMVSAHQKERKFKCQVAGCDRAFHFKYDLTAHMRRHNGDKPYKCDECGFRTTTANGLRTHKISHSDARPYTCEHCGATYKQTKHLNRHQKTCQGPQEPKFHRLEISSTNSDPGTPKSQTSKEQTKVTYITADENLLSAVEESQLLQTESLQMVLGK